MLLDNFSKVLNKLKVNLRKRFLEKSDEAIEVFLLLASSHIYKVSNANELASALGIDENRIYRELSNWRIDELRKIFVELGSLEAIEELQRLEKMSPSSKSRYQAVLSVDDTVVDRLGKLMPLTYSWYSGRWKKVVQGQNIISVTLKIKDRIIPLAIRPVSKQGRGNTSKPEVFYQMINEIVRFFKKHDLDLSKLPITMDSWYCSCELIDELRSHGFDKIVVHAKSNMVFDTQLYYGSLSQHKKYLTLEDNKWGCQDFPNRRFPAYSPTLGSVILLFFIPLYCVQTLIVFGQKLRACEIISIWRQHHSIEIFWRRLKTDFYLKSMKPQSSQGLYLMISVKLVAYLLFETITHTTKFSFYSIKMHFFRNLTFQDFVTLHFHHIKTPL